MSNKNVLFLIGVVAVAYIISQTFPSLKYPQFTVTGIQDGDTIYVRNANLEGITVRLACIDAPEMSQFPWGEQATRRLAELIPLNSTVALRIVDTDRFGRTVAEVYKDGNSVNLQMVREGQAVVYYRYLDRCNDTRENFITAEQVAKAYRIGYWEQSDPVMPWDWRRSR